MLFFSLLLLISILQIMYLHLVYDENQLLFTRQIPTGEYDGIPSGEYDEIPIRLQYIAVLNMLCYVLNPYRV